MPHPTAWAIFLALLASSCCSALNPGDAVPAFSVETLNGTLRVGGSQGSKHLPLIATVLDPSDPFCRNLFLSPDSLSGFLTRAPPEASFLFLSYSDTVAAAQAEARWMHRQLSSTADALRLPAAHRSRLFSRLHFVTQPALQVQGWLPQLLAQPEWHSPRRILRASSHPSEGSTAAPAARAVLTTTAGTARSAAAAEAGASWRPLELLSSGRLDAFYGWIPWSVSGLSAKLAVAGTDCAWLPGAAADGSDGSNVRTAGSGSGTATAAGASPGLAHLNGSLALIALTAFPSTQLTAKNSGSSRQRPPCTYGRMLQAAEAAGAVGVLFSAPAGAELAEVNCSTPAECGTAVGLPVTMAPHVVGRVLQEAAKAGDEVAVTFVEEQGPGLFFGMDASGALVEAGWLKVSSLMHAVWEAQWQVYMQRLTARLAEPALVVPLFNGQVMEGEHGLRTSVVLPGQYQQARYRRVVLDFALGCPSPFDASCPQWDHMVQLFGCCESESGSDEQTQLPMCDPCQSTVWQPQRSTNRAPQHSARNHSAHVVLALGGGGSGGGSGGRTLAAALQQQQHKGEELKGEPPLLCGRELGRWVTPFRRGVGRHVSDITPLRALLPPGAHCAFTLQTTAWAGAWVPSLSLRFTSSEQQQSGWDGRGDGNGSHDTGGGPGDASSGASGSAGKFLGGEQAPPQQQPESQQAQQQSQPKVPQQARQAEQQQQIVVPLPFDGGTFDSAYSSRHPPFSFATPRGLVRALVASRITGHGSDEHACAEFCVTTHTWTVNGRQQHDITFGDAGTLWGCADKVLDGVVPNEHGTWLYGRNGWCDGQDVPLWVLDVTAALLPPGGGNNSLVYQGEFQGGDPHPQQTPGYILMQSNLVLTLQASV